jgi:L-alanine-DL-glutamate epimerase-like enolase superfamily enzyme
MPMPPIMPRRAFLATAAAALPSLAMAAGAAPGSRRIERVEIWPVVYPMKGYFKFFHGGRNQGGRAAVLVRLTADDGTIGWGQSVPIPRWSDETLEGCAIALRDYFAPAIIGRDPADLPGLHAALDQAIAPGFTTGMPIARAGIDIAVWDMLGRAAGKPLHELWQKPAPKPLLLSWTVNVKSIADAAKSMEEGSAQGFKNFNIKVAPDLDFDEKLTREVRRLAPDTFLWADANGGYDEETAIKAAPRLAAAGADVLEAPMKPNRIRAYQKITRMKALPIFMDEGVISLADLEEFLALGMMNGMAAKPARCGGITTCMAQIDLLRERGLPWLGSGLTDPDISLAATIAVYGTRELKKPAALNGPQFLSGCVLKQPLVVKDGYLLPPDGPGLGVEVDLEKAKALAVEI